MRDPDARLRLAQEAAQLGIHEFDPTTGEIQWDARVRELWGVGPDEQVTYETFLSGLHPEDRPATERAVVAALDPTGDGKYYAEFRVSRGTDGRSRWVAATGRVTFKDGIAVRLIGTVQDITERKEAEAALSASQDLFREMANAAPALLWVADAEHQCTFLSRGWVEYTGQSMAEGLGRGWTQAVHPEDRERAAQKFLAAAERREPFTIDYRLRTKSGAYRWAIDAGRPRVAADGTFLGYIGSVIDVHERKQAEEALRRQAETFTALVEQSPLGIYTVDSQFRLRNVSVGAMPAFRNVRPLIGRDFGEVMRTIWPEPFACEAIEIFRRTLETGEPYVSSGLTEHRRDTGRLESYEWQTNRVLLADGQPGVVCYFFDSTRLQQAHAAVRKSERFYRQTLESIPGMVFTTTAEGACDYLSQPWVEYTGIAEGEQLGDRWVQALHPDDRARAFATWQSAVEGRGAYDLEYRVRRHDGVYEWFKARGQPLRDAAGTIAGWLGVVINIEDLKRAETALRDSEERFRTLADHMSQLAWMTDETGWIFWYNRRWYAYTGTTLEQVQGWGWKQLHHPEHVDRVVAKIAHCFATGETWEDTFPLRGKDGAYRWFLSRAIPIRDTAGRIVRWFGTNTDISELREAEEALRASERQLSLVMDMAPVHIAYLDPHGKYRYVNRAYAERLGLRPEDVVGRHVTEVLGPEIWKQVEQHVAEVLAGRPVEFETSVTYPQVGMRHIHARYAPEVDAAGTVQGFVAVVTDITAQRELEQQRAALLESERSARTALERAMRAKDEFLSVVNHELRSPLAVVLGWTRMLRDGKLSGDELQEAVESIWRGGEQLKHLIDDLLDTSRALAGKLKVNPAPVDLGALARQAVADHQPEARERDVRLTEELPAGEFLVLADAGRLRQVIGNLLSNALKFTPAGGRVRLRVLPSRSRVMIAVEDTGIGIDPDVLPRLFERFRQADSSIARKYKGLGLGLALVKQIVEMHGGHVHAESGGMSQGATFMVELPRLESVAQAPGSSGWDVDLTGVRVLAVDDDPAALGLTARLLEECGATVRRCYSGAEALEVLAAGGFDLLISDVSMPEMDGYTLLRKVRALPSVHAGLPAIAVTAFGREEDERRSLEAGFVAHHTKPLNPAELCAGVQVLAKRNGRAEFRADGEKSLVIGGAD